MTCPVDILNFFVGQETVDDCDARNPAHVRLSARRFENKSNVWNVQSQKSLEEHSNIFARIVHVSDGIKSVLGCVWWWKWRSGGSMPKKFPVSLWKLTLKYIETKLTRYMNGFVSIDQQSVHGMDRFSLTDCHVEAFSALGQMTINLVELVWNWEHKCKPIIVLSRCRIGVKLYVIPSD
jgi:hypothetical protein